jgi:hypothetical protein
MYTWGKATELAEDGAIYGKRDRAGWLLQEQEHRHQAQAPK